MRFIGILGIFLVLGIAFALSTNRKKINYRTVAWGLGMQLLLGLFVMKTAIGKNIFQFLGKLVNKLLEFTNEGSHFVFGNLVPTDPNFNNNLGFLFAFQVLPAIIFVGSLAGIAYYLGIIQFCVKWVAKLMVMTMGTSGAESLYAVTTVFLGQSEAPLIIKPYLQKLTRSELNSIMTGGMATIAGSVLFIYVGMLGPEWAPHIITASIMGAPAGLVLSKILCPEEGTPDTLGKIEINEEKKDKSIIEAASSGAIEGMHLALIVGAMLITFIALIATINGVLGRCGHMFGCDSFSIQTILGFVLYPVTFCIGVPSADASAVGALIGEKIVLNEAVAYTHLLEQMKAGVLSEKAILIAS